MKFFWILVMSTTLTSCATPVRYGFCDGWSTNDGSGNSIEWTPTAKQMQKIKTQLGSDRAYICSEINPSGKVSVIGHDSSGTLKYIGLNYLLSDAEITFVDEEVFVSSH